MSGNANLFIAREKDMLSPFAFPSANTRGRMTPIEPCEHRTEFQRDRDRILHCKSFRRLMNKTQVFFSPVDEHYRTRLTHTLEVTQIARIIARALRLNEDLTEAIAMGHDLGHTPFGHAGEQALRDCFDPTFKHNEQSLRVVDILERDGHGLNLTWEVRDGIVNHTGDNMASTLEGVVVKFADRIAYINHDIDDACRGGLLSLDQIPKGILSVLGQSHSDRINTMVSALIEASQDKNEISMKEAEYKAMMELRDYLFRHVYRNSAAKEQEDKAKRLLYSLYEYFVAHPEELPPLYRSLIDRDGVGRCVCDYISCMTDRYAIHTYERLFVPEVWKGVN